MIFYKTILYINVYYHNFKSGRLELLTSIYPAFEYQKANGCWHYNNDALDELLTLMI